MAKYMTEQELYHHGILGQKWGVRRFQNQDGSYTAAGRERYGIEDGKHRSLKSYALEYKDRRENKNRYTRMKKNQNLDTMSFDEMKRLQEREALKGQIQWQQKQNDPNAWKKQLGRELVSTAAKGLVDGASKELGRQIINAPVRLASYAGDKTISAAGWSARELVSVATDNRKQMALKNLYDAVDRNAGTQTRSFFNGAAGAAKGFGKEMGSQAKSFGSGLDDLTTASEFARGAKEAGSAAARNAKAFGAGLKGDRIKNNLRGTPGSYTGSRAVAYENGQNIRTGMVNAKLRGRELTGGIRNEANAFNSGARQAARGFTNEMRNQRQSFTTNARRAAASARSSARIARDDLLTQTLPNATYQFDYAHGTNTRGILDNALYNKKYGYYIHHR